MVRPQRIRKEVWVLVFGNLTECIERFVNNKNITLNMKKKENDKLLRKGYKEMAKESLKITKEWEAADLDWDDDSSDLIKLSEQSLKEVWDNEEDEIWNKYLKKDERNKRSARRPGNNEGNKRSIERLQKRKRKNTGTNRKRTRSLTFTS